MLYIQYLAMAAVIVYATLSLSYYVDVIDRRTTISGALLGGVLLAAITSLPELITSLTSAIYLNEGAYAFGNVLGSNLFNMVILAGADLVFIRHVFFNEVNPKLKPSVVIFLMYLTFLIPLGLEVLGVVPSSTWTLNLGITLNLSSLLILGLYVFSLNDINQPEVREEADDSPLSMTMILLRFIFWALIVIAGSIVVTLLTEDIAIALGLSQSFAGAIFLGIATSLPELTAVIALFRLRNYAVALGNILGSNAFNFLVIALTDIAVIRSDIFQAAIQDSTILDNLTWLLLLGALNTIILAVALKKKPTQNRILYYMFPAAIVLVYGGYLWVSI